MTWPPPRCSAWAATLASRILNLTFRIGSSHRGPSRLPHWKPCSSQDFAVSPYMYQTGPATSKCYDITWTTDSRIALSRDLSTSDGSVSSNRIFGPCVSGPNAQMDRAASTSQSYLLWKKSPSRRFGQSILTVPASISSAKPYCM